MEEAEMRVFQNIHAVGGPTNVREWFVDNPDEIDETDILYHLVQDQYAIVT